MIHIEREVGSLQFMYERICQDEQSGRLLSGCVSAGGMRTTSETGRPARNIILPKLRQSSYYDSESDDTRGVVTASVPLLWSLSKFPIKLNMFVSVSLLGAGPVSELE